MYHGNSKLARCSFNCHKNCTGFDLAGWDWVGLGWFELDWVGLDDSLSLFRVLAYWSDSGTHGYGIMPSLLKVLHCLGLGHMGRVTHLVGAISVVWS